MTTIRATDVAAILGDDPYNSPHDVWCRIKNGRENSQSHAARTKWGSRLEAAVLEEYADNNGMSLIFPKDAQKSIIVGRADALHGSTIVEAKVTVSYAHRTWDGLVPVRYWLQVQAYMWLYNCDAAVLCVYCRDNDKYYEYAIPREDISDAIRRIEEWHAMYILGDAIPPNELPLRSDAGTQLHATPELADLVATWHRLAREEKERANEIDLIKEQVKEFMGANEELWCDGVPAVTWRSSTRTSFDATAFKKASPAEHAKFVKTTATRTMLLLSRKKGEF